MSEPALAAAPPLTIRRLPLPQCEPPYDDEVGDAGGHGPGADTGPRPHVLARHAHGPSRSAEQAGAVALSLPLEIPGTRAPRPRPPLRLVPAVPPVRGAGPAPSSGVATRPTTPDDGLARTPRAQLPDPRGTAGRLVQVLLEVLAGERPASQVMRYVSLAVYSDLVATPPRVRSGQARPTAAPQVTSVRVSEPDDGVAEVCAVTRRGGRYRAVALRLEGQGGRWRCVALQVG